MSPYPKLTVRVRPASSKSGVPPTWLAAAPQPESRRNAFSDPFDPFKSGGGFDAADKWSAVCVSAAAASIRFGDRAERKGKCERAISVAIGLPLQQKISSTAKVAILGGVS